MVASSKHAIPNKTQHCDVLVAGSGASGMVAAIVTAKKGLKVIVAERSGVRWHNSVIGRLSLGAEQSGEHRSWGQGQQGRGARVYEAQNRATTTTLRGSMHFSTQVPRWLPSCMRIRRCGSKRLPHSRITIRMRRVARRAVARY